MKVFSITVMIFTDDSFEGKKPDLDMFKAYVREKINIGEVKEKIFRHNVIAKIQDVQIYGNQLM